jgi:hypothetical protein
MGKQRPKIARQIGREWLLQVLFPHCHSLFSHCHQDHTFSPSPPLSSSLCRSGIRQIHSRGGDTPIPIRALSFALDVVGVTNAASKRCDANPSIARQEIFGVISYPKISHMDNGKEFTAKLILQFLCAMNPNILTVTGHPRHPRDQGSIENMKKFVKRILVMVLAERRLAREKPNWTEVLGSVATTINSQHGCGKNDLSSYKAVFGHKFNHKFACSKEEARRCCWTLDERMRVTNDKKFEEYVQEYCWKKGVQDPPDR